MRPIPGGRRVNYFITFSTTPRTAEDREDYATLSERESFTRSEYGRDADTDPFVARKLLSDFGFAIVDDADLPPRVVPHPMLVPAAVEGREGRASSGTRATA